MTVETIVTVLIGVAIATVFLVGSAFYSNKMVNKGINNKSSQSESSKKKSDKEKSQTRCLFCLNGFDEHPEWWLSCGHVMHKPCYVQMNKTCIECSASQQEDKTDKGDSQKTRESYTYIDHSLAQTETKPVLSKCGVCPSGFDISPALKLPCGHVIHEKCRVDDLCLECMLDATETPIVNSLSM